MRKASTKGLVKAMDGVEEASNNMGAETNIKVDSDQEAISIKGPHTSHLVPMAPP
ncbi:hypothetical protein FRC02_009067 [Tulasnella sp. 418]|nr:hypothetical protein FRC02_009067 [Tulasnella sp. 418]